MHTGFRQFQIEYCLHRRIVNILTCIIIVGVSEPDGGADLPDQERQCGGSQSHTHKKKNGRCQDNASVLLLASNGNNANSSDDEDGKVIRQYFTGAAS